jgi:hypothetical protein
MQALQGLVTDRDGLFSIMPSPPGLLLSALTPKSRNDLHSASRDGVRTIADLNRLGSRNVGVAVLQFHLQRQRLRAPAHQLRGVEQIAMVLRLRHVEPKVRLDPVGRSRHELDGGGNLGGGGRKGNERGSLHLCRRLRIQGSVAGREQQNANEAMVGRRYKDVYNVRLLIR